MRVVPEDLFVITGSRFAVEVARQLVAIDPRLATQLILEPAPRSTCAAIALGISWAQQRGAQPNDVFFVATADHLINPEEAFGAVLDAAQPFARAGNLVVFGVTPTRAETGFGYIQAGDAVNGAFHVRRFVEKPNLATAESYLEKGSYFWNAGMFAFTASAFHHAVEQHLPPLSQALSQGLAMLLDQFAALPNISIDYALLEKSDKVVVLPLNLSWIDVGSWENVYELLSKDANANAFQGQVVALDTRNSLVLGGKRLIATVGIEDLIIIDTPEALLVAKRSDAQKVKTLVESLPR